MAKFYLFMIVCIYNPTLSLEDTCKIFPQTAPYDSLLKCLDAGEAIRYKLREGNKDVYPTAFCSEKNFNYIKL